ncbi:hypothetical protein O181_027948 [Austropuccinia psidii MF-1]|uniref:GAG-pre-integrase domain-containing protein n=1 Tax=Austropuccinia psidii MF-1 TaxID=1389203 RepID=A0A9Q3CSS1_9BASI|nr:hypothetical protein [Austropuccinia psidii MF-1]
MGTVNLFSNNQVLMLLNSLFVPKLNCNLVSLLKIFNKELTINLDEGSISPTTKAKEILWGKIENNLMESDHQLPTAYKTVAKENPWHEKLGHAGRSVIKLMALPSSNDLCKLCDLNKIHHLPFKDHFESVELPLHCVHVNLVGPISALSISGYRYFLTIEDHATSYKIV